MCLLHITYITRLARPYLKKHKNFRYYQIQNQVLNKLQQCHLSLRILNSKWIMGRQIGRTWHTTLKEIYYTQSLIKKYANKGLGVLTPTSPDNRTNLLHQPIISPNRRPQKLIEGGNRIVYAKSLLTRPHLVFPKGECDDSTRKKVRRLLHKPLWRPEGAK